MKNLKKMIFSILMLFTISTITYGNFKITNSFSDSGNHLQAIDQDTDKHF